MTIKGGTTSKTLHSGVRLAAIDTIIARQGCGAGMGCIAIAKYRLGHATFPTVGFIIKAPKDITTEWPTPYLRSHPWVLVSLNVPF